MVSLINFKIVNEELRENQLQRTRVTLAGAAEAQVQNGHVNQISVLNQSVAQHQQNEATNQQHQRTLDENRMQATDTSTLVLNGSQQQDSEAGKMKQHGDQYHTHSPAGAMQLSSLPMQVEQLSLASQKLTSSIVLHHHHHNQQLQLNQQPPAAPAQYGRQPSGDIQSGEPNFVVTWRNLRFAIEPKWHQRMVNASSAACMGGKTGAGGNKVQQAAAGSGPQNPVTKIVLDKLDGSFRSGELTAILGPSGAGKTTLLDCLTGHRKHGLSGSIKISSPNSASTFSASSSSSACSHATSKSYFSNHQQPSGDRLTHRRYPSLGGNAYKVDGAQRASIDQQTNIDKHLNLVAQHCCTKQHAPASQSAGTSVADNLKVSIIPQNDHLMGHLTVYETLNYASKMKNCFDKQFNHKLNIRRVAQQLGLMSCLGTRINKLSGGQYKRVSIAQELLSSPDILILDEPTSGLDAMTCYQTVQVLRKLTDDRQANGQNQIAVILTIHQPNSDVFQQFNHVYVVAQGGKCIYEGSPASIESVINRVGIRLPNSYYNPATMIVEIAAAKFGLEAIDKLNAIQKKQYESVAFAADSTRHEQNSTGDSAVDCRSSSSSNSNDDDDYDDDGSAADDDVEGNGNGNGVSGAGAGSGDRQPGRGAGEAGKAQDDNNNCKPLLTEINNNLELAAAMISEAARVGLVNKGFVMESEEEPAGNNGKSKDVIVVVPSHKLQLPSGDANSGDKIKAATKVSCGGEKQQQVVSSDHGGHCQDFGRKKRRRTRKRSAADQQPATGADKQQVVAAVGANGRSGGGGGDDDGGSGGGGGREKRLKLNSLKADQKFPFWRHTYLHFHRSWLSIVRDPMLCSMQLALHIIVPVMVSLVYGTNVGKPNACPRAGPMDIMAYALEPTDSALQLQEDLRTTLENIGYIFFKLYGIIFAAMTVTVLTFPLDMHVLVKEFRNGWYGLSSYFLGRTLADIPFQLTLPLLAMSLSYYATGQPYSYMQWRFLSITGILILSSLIAQSQGLLFGAILMDKMKAAVFVAPAATTPIILFAGFLVRTQSIPRYLRPLSNLSYLRYAIEACLISRYGFNQCECDPAIFNQTVPELPPIARSMLDYWLSSFKASANQDAHDGTSSATDAAILETTTQLASSSGNPDLFTKLIDSLAKANSFGRNITSCEQVVPYPMIDYDLKDSQLFNCFAILLFMLVFTRLLTFFIVCFKVKRKV